MKACKVMKTDTYLSHCYVIPETPPILPLADEAFVTVWKEVKGNKAWEFLTETAGRDVASFPLRQEETLRIFFAETLGGHLPVIVTGNRDDFLRVEALLNGREDLANFPVTVNAFTMQARAKNIRNHRVILLGQAPYSNVPADLLGLDEEEWIERSCLLRFAHECVHYEILRLFGGMQNHALDEIVADAMGQLAAFGNFSAARQRLFFGLEQSTGRCTGRLSFYCRNVLPWERVEVYRAVDATLDFLEDRIERFLTENKRKTETKESLSSVKTLLSDKESKYELLSDLAGTSIAERYKALL